LIAIRELKLLCGNEIHTDGGMDGLHYNITSDPMQVDNKTKSFSKWF